MISLIRFVSFAPLNAIAHADIVEKSYADSFEQTNLEQVLQNT
jgi:hypothetical protein